MQSEPTNHQRSAGFDERRKKIELNYETIRVLKERLEAQREQQEVGLTRQAYIKMIFDVTTKVDEQNVKLQRAIQDTRRLQKDISNLSDRLERSFAFAKDIILKVMLQLCGSASNTL